VTGGTLFNRQLLAALAAREPALSFGQCSLEQLAFPPQARQLWVDSLYLAELSALRSRVASATGIGLLLHYLPSLLTKPSLSSVGELTQTEQQALTAADMIVTPSDYLQRLLTELCPAKLCACVTPGVECANAKQLGSAIERDGSVLMVRRTELQRGGWGEQQFSGTCFLQAVRRRRREVHRETGRLPASLFLPS